MSLMERFNVICWGNDFLLGLCVRKTECPEGSTEKYNILASFSINFMALSFIFTAPPKEEKMWRYIPTTRRPVIEMSLITSQLRMLIALPPSLSSLALWHLPFQPGHPSFPPSPLHFSVLCSTLSRRLLSLPPSLFTLHLFLLAPARVFLFHHQSLFILFSLSLSLPPSVFWTTKSLVLDGSINHQLHIESQW